MHTRLPHLLIGAAGLLLAGTLTGCATAPSSAPAATRPAAATSPRGPHAASAPDALCSVLPLASANAVVGVVFTAAEDSVDGSTGDRVCTYGSSDGSAVAVLGLVTPGRTTFEQLSARGGSPTAVDQVGDRAAEDGDELDFETHGRLFYVISTGTSALGLGELVALGSATVAHLS